MSKFNHAGLGGTFDRLHIGHQEFIQTALHAAQHISIGVTSEQFSHAKTLHQLIQPFDKRVEQLTKYLTKIRAQNRSTIFRLNDIYGSTLKDRTIDCLVVTQHTYQGAQVINQTRATKNLDPLPIMKAKLIKDQSHQYISSTRIRQGKINREGFVYDALLANDIVPSPQLRKILKKPFGTCLQEDELVGYVNRKHPLNISTVGDQTTATLMRQNIPINVGIFDNHIMRIPSNLMTGLIEKNPNYQIKKTHNPAGRVNRQAAALIKQSLYQGQTLVQVDGEEDLLVIPLIILQSLGSTIFYGQPNKGIIAIEVTEESKAKIKQLITN